MESVERGGRRGPDAAQKKESTREGADGTESGITAAAMPNGLASDPVFLVCEGEGDEGDREKFGIRTIEGLQAPTANSEPNILDTKKVVGRGSWSSTVFARPK